VNLIALSARCEQDPESGSVESPSITTSFRGNARDL
jgi:hypothetical protein